MTAAPAARRETQNRPYQVRRQLQKTVGQQTRSILVRIEAVEIGVNQPGAAKHDMQAVFRAFPARPELRVEAAHLRPVQDAERPLPEAPAVPQDVSCLHGIGKPEHDSIARGSNGSGFGLDPEMPQSGFDPGSFSCGRKHPGSVSQNGAAPEYRVVR